MANVGGAHAEIKRLNHKVHEQAQEIAKQRKQLEKWRRFGRNVLNQLEDWSTGHISRGVFISKETEATIRRLLDE